MTQCFHELEVKRYNGCPEFATLRIAQCIYCSTEFAEIRDSTISKAWSDIRWNLPIGILEHTAHNQERRINVI